MRQRFKIKYDRIIGRIGLSNGWITKSMLLYWYEHLDVNLNIVINNAFVFNQNK